MQTDHTVLTINGNGNNNECANGSSHEHEIKNLLNLVGTGLSEATKIKMISRHFHQIMLILGLDLEDDSLKGTPDRVAKMYVREIFSGLDPAQKPEITLFENSYKYNEMLIEKNITLYSTCEHHFVPIIGKAHVAYFFLTVK
jgi:GTP cyclohydrolase IA